MKILGKLRRFFLGKINRFCQKLVRALIGRFLYNKDLNTYKNIWKKKDYHLFKYERRYKYPKYNDRFISNANSMDQVYFFGSMFLAREILKNGAGIKHYDIGSSVYHLFSKLLTMGMKVNAIDIRPMEIEIPGVNFVQGDAMNLYNFEDESIDSLSSMYAVEHFGLGRYGDPIDVEGWYKGLKEMQRVLSIGGMLYLVLPIGSRPLLRFNAHRVFTPQLIAETLDKMQIKKFAYVKNWSLVENTNLEDYQEPDIECGGFFVFEKIK